MRWLTLMCAVAAICFATRAQAEPRVCLEWAWVPSDGVAWSRLRADLGRWAIPLAAVCAAAPFVILLGGTTARETYFTLAYFHIGLEAAALVGLLRSL
jgi:hypothetical protein